MSQVVAETSQRRERWLRQRKSGIGASEAAVVLGVSPYKDRLTLWLEKTGEVEPEDLADNERVIWGDVLESAVAAEYSRRTGHRLANRGKYTIDRHETHPELFATIDRDIEAVDERGPGVLEIKTTGHHMREEWQDGAPLQYLIQVQHQLLCTGRQWGALACLIGGQKLVIHEVPRHDGIIESIVAECLTFWRMVRERQRPSLADVLINHDQTRSALRALSRLHPDDNGETVELGDEFAEIDRTLHALKAERKLLDHEIDALELRIRDALGPNTYGVLPNGVKYAWKTQERPEYVAKASKFRVLRRSEPKGGAK